MEERINQFNKVLEILNMTNEDNHFGLVYVKGVTLDQVEKVRENCPLYIEDWDTSWNDAPTANELITFVKANPEFTFEGYVTEPEERNGETRFNLTGISAPESHSNVANLYAWINDENNEFIEPTELDSTTGDIRAWWD